MRFLNKLGNTYKTDKLMERWLKSGMELGMNFIDVYAPEGDEVAPKAVAFAQDEQAFKEFFEDLVTTNKKANRVFNKKTAPK